MECFKNYGFEEEGFNCGFTLSFNLPRGWRASPPKRAAGKPSKKSGGQVLV